MLWFLVLFHARPAHRTLLLLLHIRALSPLHGRHYTLCCHYRHKQITKPWYSHCPYAWYPCHHQVDGLAISTNVQGEVWTDNLTLLVPCSVNWSIGVLFVHNVIKYNFPTRHFLWQVGLYIQLYWTFLRSSQLDAWLHLKDVWTPPYIEPRGWLLHQT